MSKNPRHLTKQFNTWTYQRRVPKELKEHPLFIGMTTIRKSLKTDSLQVALKLRDEEDAKLEALINGDLIVTTEQIYQELVDQMGPPLAPKSEEDKSNLRHIVDTMRDKYRIGNTLHEDYKKDAELMAFSNYINRMEGDNKHPIDATLKQALQLTKTKATKDGRAPRYINSYDNVVSKFLNFLQLPDIGLNWIDTTMVDEYIEHRLEAVSSKTTKNDITTLSAIFKTAKRKRMVDTDNPFTHTGISTKNKKIRQAFSVSEARKILEGLPERFKLAWTITYYTGVRRDELFKLNSSSIVNMESQNGNIKCFSIAPDGDGKTESATRFIPIHPDLEPLLDNFSGFDFKPNTFSTHRLTVTKEIFGEEFAESHTLHSLRHTFSTTLHNHFPEQPQVVDWLTGHNRTLTTESYQTYFHGYGLDKLYDAIKVLPKL
ncbi:tyrosine-type recombinase/integrase [Thiomicrorhabdus chilensis]|uniref:tyrosine-type recombinase/integrase n=1 Tax=Thiomicrorhabdus chilensis TaxID=63656 RepID=UPI00040A1041|nr:DUF6538 domain-containing protein [Thiomicrorhabdus chilensis]